MPKKAKELTDKPDLALCTTCHRSGDPDHLHDEVAEKYIHPYFNHIVLPEKGSKEEGH